jgi:hypothetical protein
MFTKKAFKKNMAILACVALVSLFLPAISSPYEVKIPRGYTSSTSTIAQNLLYATLSVELLIDELTQSDPPTIQGVAKSKKKPKSRD